MIFTIIACPEVRSAYRKRSCRLLQFANPQDGQPIVALSYHSPPVICRELIEEECLHAGSSLVKSEVQVEWIQTEWIQMEKA
jgi:hypothetical protein